MRLIKLLTISVTALTLVSFVYGEEELEWEDPRLFNGTDSECNQIWTDEHGVMTCKWHVTQEPTISVVQDLTPEEQEIIDNAKDCRDNNYQDPECIEPTVDYPTFEEPWGWVVKEKEKTPLVEHLENLCRQDRLEESEKEICRLAQDITYCDQGFGKLETIQAIRSFQVSAIEPDKTKAWGDIDQKSLLKILLMGHEECKATHTEHDDVLSEMYANFVVDGIFDPAPYHAEYAKHQTPYKTQRITENTWLSTLGAAYDAICSNDLYSQSYKKQQGCIPEPIRDCHMPTDEELLWTHKNMWIPEYAVTPIKEIYQDRYDECQDKISKAQLKPVGWYDDYLHSLDPMAEYLKYKKTDGKDYPAPWANKRTISISDMGSQGADVTWEFYIKNP